MDRIVCGICGHELTKLKSGMVFERTSGNIHRGDLFFCKPCSKIGRVFRIYGINETVWIPAITEEKPDTLKYIRFHGDPEEPY